MIALPDTLDFVSHAPRAQGTPVVARPNVTQQFWGYEISKSEHIITLASLGRSAAAIAAAASAMATVLVWLVPAMSFVGFAVASKATASGSLAIVAFLLAQYTSRGTQIRVQVDTSSGELREVVDGSFGSVHVLSKYGFDAVTRVDIETSTKDPAFGQIQVSMKRGGPVVAGDGVVIVLQSLRRKIEKDCGLDVQGNQREVIWSGPLKAA